MDIEDCWVIEKQYRLKGFTLAETLIVVSIIGIVAALTLPSILRNHHNFVLKNQFKTTYSLLQQAWLKAQADLEYTPECFYWETNPYGTALCVERNAAGECSKYEYADGSPLAGDHNGRFNDCPLLADQILANLKVIKTCTNNAFSKGCIPEYEGIDTIYKASNNEASDYDVTKNTSGCGGLRKEYIQKNASAHVLSNGAILVGYGTFRPHIFFIDVNGAEPPNKWGYDVFGFQTISMPNSGLKIKGNGCMRIETGGTLTSSMILEILK